MPVAVITGGNRGLGLFQTKKFLKEGYRVFVVSRAEGNEFQSLRAETDPGQLSWIEYDLGNWREPDYLDVVYDRVESVDALVNNAGVHLKKPVWDVEPEELENVLDINLKALFSGCRAYVDRQIDFGGSIVNLSSMAGLIALPSAAAYVTSKTAVIGLTRSIAVDAAVYGIRCNAVCPGFIKTDMTDAILARDPARRDKIESRIPTHNFGRPEDVANACFFLSSAEAAYINGVSLPVDAGYSIGF